MYLMLQVLENKDHIRHCNNRSITRVSVSSAHPACLLNVRLALLDTKQTERKNSRTGCFICGVLGLVRTIH